MESNTAVEPGGMINPGVQVNPRCGDPDNPLVIDAEGHVVLCANDYRSSIKFGHVAERPLIDIWNDPEFKRIRRNLRGHRYTLVICHSCVGKS